MHAHTFMMFRRFTLGLALSVSLGAVGVAHAGLFDDDEARRAILDLREKQNNYQAASNERLDQQSRSLLMLQNQIDSLKQELAKVRGQNEVLQSELATLQKAQKDNYASLDERVRKFEPQVMVVDGREGMVAPTEKSEYERALQVFKDGDFKGAGVAFAGFLKKYPQSLYVPLAQYWYGNTLYAARDYRGSTAQFQALLRSTPTHPKAADAMLGIANNQVEMGQKNTARKTLEQVTEQYPNTEAATAAKERLAALK